MITEALQSLRPKSQWVLRGDVLEWLDTKQTEPTQPEIDAEIVRLTAEDDAQAYSRNREAEYPSIQECVHAILDDTLDALQAKRASVKLKYPKGG
jgi:hypothetical protein